MDKADSFQSSLSSGVIANRSKTSILDKTIIDARNAHEFIDYIAKAAQRYKSIIFSDSELVKYAEDYRLLILIKKIVESQENPDDVVLKLGRLINPIQRYDKKMADLINEYFRNRKELNDILRFLYSNLTPEGLRKIRINFGILINELAKMKDQPIFAKIYPRLNLLKRVFDEMDKLESPEYLRKEKIAIGKLVGIISLGIKNGTWSGFLGKNGLAKNADVISIFENESLNRMLREMMVRNKKRYGESQPQNWLGDRKKIKELPDSLWSFYGDMDSIITSRIVKLWENANRIARSLREVIEEDLGKNPSLALDKIIRRATIFERSIKRQWASRRNEFKLLFINAAFEEEEAEKIIMEIESHDQSDKVRLIADSIAYNLRFERLAKKIVSAGDRTGPSMDLLGNLALTARMFENNKLFQNKTWESLANPVYVDQKLKIKLDKAVSSTITEYSRLFDFVESLRLAIDVGQIKTSIGNYKGAING